MINIEKKLNFSVGPVEMEPEILAIENQGIPYFRTNEFSELNNENAKLIKKFIKTNESSKVIFLTASGTGAMEAAVTNTFTKDDKVIIVNGGSFGDRFVKICRIHDIPYKEIKLNYGETLKPYHLEELNNQGYTGFLVNVHETSTGTYYDMELISKFCKANNLFLIVDAISSFLADEYKMDNWGVDISIISSQKALALPPGISILVANDKAVNKINTSNYSSLYFGLKEYLKDGERGQTPFTPAVGILMQLNYRLNKINEIGLDKYILKSKENADYFRSKIAELPLEVVSEKLSNAVTPLMVTGSISAKEIFETLKNEYDIFVCPNGGELGDRLFRVGHIGDLNSEDNNKLINALFDMRKRGKL